MKKRIQFTNNPELNELWASDSWSRQLIIELLRKNQIGYLYSPTTMGEPAFRIHTREEFNQAKRIVQDYEEDD